MLKGQTASQMLKPINIYKEKAEVDLPEIQFGSYTSQIEVSESENLAIKVLSPEKLR